MPDDAFQSDQCAELLKALAEPLRLRLIDALRDQPRNVTELANLLEIDMVIVSHHLTILRHSGLVQRTKQGRFALYALREGVWARGQIDLGCCKLKLTDPKA